ncbi:hypothetical protein PIB30_091217 [Stylosanthes scabra]|uniref:Transketolase-like pyrimidine-binding domain-containing protein n=1 Tax=Stylosanthes scabra TaxID=79078 RepID=A0ABU6VSZ0_9FABA|nr:hypothetical protein [Stylosanthes scabra]
MDGAGLVGADGPTHCGAFDITYMACLPNMVVMAPSDEAELMPMVATTAATDDRPSCFRFPRGNGIGAVLPLNNKGTVLENHILYSMYLQSTYGNDLDQQEAPNSNPDAASEPPVASTSHSSNSSTKKKFSIHLPPIN